MSISINRITLLGRLGRDPKVFHPEGGEKSVALSLATSESWKDRQTGEPREKTEWHHIAIFAAHIVSLAEKHLHKGSRVLVEGKLQTSKWIDRNAIERWTTEVVLGRFGGELILLDKPDCNDRPDEAAMASDDRQNRAEKEAEDKGDLG